jgi:hypothetical protein
MTEWGIDTLFNPGKRHMDEEKRRLQSTREEIGDSSGGRRIDLESGTVKISRSTPAAAEQDEVRDDEAPEQDEGGKDEAEQHEAEQDEVTEAGITGREADEAQELAEGRS